MRKSSIAAAFATASAFISVPAAASGLVDFSAGAKGLVGGSLWTTPSAIPAGYQGLGFAGSAGGFAYDLGGYVEARFIKVIGVEADVLYDSTILQRNVTYDNVVKTTEKVTMTGARIPLLIKGILPLPAFRLWAGIGPEFLVGESAKPDLSVTSSPIPVTGVSGLIHAKAKSSTLLALALGMVFDLPASLELPIDLRASKNLSQDDSWSDRVGLAYSGTSLTGYTVTAQSSWDFRLGVGLGYSF